MARGRSRHRAQNAAALGRSMSVAENVAVRVGIDFKFRSTGLAAPSHKKEGVMEVLNELKHRLSPIFEEFLLELKYGLLFLLFINLRILAVVVFNIVGFWLIFKVLVWIF